MGRRRWWRLFVKEDELALFVFGTHAGTLAVLLGWETYITGNGRFFWPTLWPPVFAAAWLACVIYHAQRRSRWWWQASCALLVAAYTSRALSIALAVQADREWTAARGVGIATWISFAVIVAGAWQRRVTPWRRS